MPLGSSTVAAQNALMQVIPSRIAMSAPAMFVPPVLMSYLEKTKHFVKHPWLKTPVTVSASCYTRLFNLMRIF